MCALDDFGKGILGAEAGCTEPTICVEVYGNGLRSHARKMHGGMWGVNRFIAFWETQGNVVRR